MKQQVEVQQWKKEEVEALAKLINEHKMVGIIDMKGMPSPNLRKLKHTINGKALLKMSKKSFIERALEKTNVKQLKTYLKGQPALLLSNVEPFGIEEILRKNRIKAAPKPNSVMLSDILIPAGETPFTPGPMLAELQSLGIKAGSEKGKIVIKEDVLLAKAGEKISKKKADVMAKLGIEPFEIGLALNAAYFDNLLFTQESLGITPEKVRDSVKKAYTSAFNLAFNSGYPTTQNIKLFLQKAYRQAKSLALGAKYTCSATISELLAEAHSKAMALKSHVKEEPAAEQK